MESYQDGVKRFLWKFPRLVSKCPFATHLLSLSLSLSLSVCVCVAFLLIKHFWEKKLMCYSSLCIYKITYWLPHTHARAHAHTYMSTQVDAYNCEYESSYFVFTLLVNEPNPVNTIWFVNRCASTFSALYLRRTRPHFIKLSWTTAPITNKSLTCIQMSHQL